MILRAPKKYCRTSLGGSTLTPLTTPRFHFLLNQYIYVQLYATYQFGNLYARYSHSVSHSQSKLWPSPPVKIWQIQPWLEGAHHQWEASYRLPYADEFAFALLASTGDTRNPRHLRSCGSYIINTDDLGEMWGTFIILTGYITEN